MHSMYVCMHNIHSMYVCMHNIHSMYVCHNVQSTKMSWLTVLVGCFRETHKRAGKGKWPADVFKYTNGRSEFIQT